LHPREGIKNTENGNRHETGVGEKGYLHLNTNLVKKKETGFLNEGLIGAHLRGTK